MKAEYGIAVVGAGIVGATTALALAERGLDVVLVDRKGVALEASFGNAGAFAFSDILPLASPGIVMKAPRWLLDPLGPLSVPPAYLPRIAPWLVRFVLAGTPARYQRSVTAQAALMALSERETEALLDRTGLAGRVSRHGALHLYDDVRSFDAAREGWKVRDAHAIAHEHLDRSGIDSRQPGLDRRFQHATFVPGWSNVDDPHGYAVAIADHAKARGARLVEKEVTALRQAERGITLICSDGSGIAAGQVVVAAGAWSHRLARTVGDRIPLETERGYNTTLPPGAFPLDCQLVFEDHGFVVSPLAVGVRVGGAVELAGLDRPPNFRRAETMLDKAKAFMPDLDTGGGRQWMGFRPSTPDSLPVVGRSSRVGRVIYAFGHGHLGLTQSAATARLVADIALDRQPEIPLLPYSPDRF